VRAYEEYREGHPHLLEKARLELACDYLVHEFRKIFREMRKEEAREEIKRFDPFRQGDDRTIRDFWNLFCAMSSTWRLKDLNNVVTNPKINWTKRPVSIELLVPGTQLGWMKELGPEFMFDSAVNYLKQDSRRLEQALERSEKHRRERPGGSEDDPIIAQMETETKYKVLDGNSRLTQALERYVSSNSKIPQLNTWVGCRTDTVREEYWIPTGSLFFLHQSIEDKQQVERILRFKYPLGFVEFQKRVTQAIPQEE
jgi:hypothetical protein